jgi:CheY-like chemotaxis protein
MSLVMVIDDMAIVREPIAASLREQGYRTVCAAEGREALATVRAETPDLILLDLSMPGMDGMDVLRAFRRENATARTPVILLTASADKQHVVEAARLGVRDYLLKSKFSFPELLVRVRKYLNPLKPREDVISSATRSLSANVAAADAGATASVATCAKVSSTMTQIPRLLTREQCIERATEVRRHCPSDQPRCITPRGSVATRRDDRTRPHVIRKGPPSCQQYVLRLGAGPRFHPTRSRSKHWLLRRAEHRLHLWGVRRHAPIGGGRLQSHPVLAALPRGGDAVRALRSGSGARTGLSDRSLPRLGLDPVPHAFRRRVQATPSSRIDHRQVPGRPAARDARDHPRRAS